MSDWNDDGEGAPDGWLPGGDDAPAGWLGSHGDDDDAWRGDAHAGDWPEWNAGPEYHMWRRLAERERDADDGD
jgi:hypothetical protein